MIAYEAAAAHNIIVLFPNFSLVHHFFPFGSLSLLCNKLLSWFNRLERSRDGFDKMISKEVIFERKTNLLPMGH